ncbi:L-2-hydroxyglutarate dehydrogenase, mitochondrial [Zootermopsis nevadensis]|uniref:L-2-hydroxyglutarate dehydrogenase, mitochondrial n=1 Tax=Zootermopsis nevadensis TaxID=136037 RepID=A0A067QIC4_ZOONE|nr:L-2-hydroxyglutarate dehydrogenase, mitochondrial [Zootermopsis nevadensis]KDR08345.1 L-2-hydroxyglutarate dehydrogenase, mitochondrial [Zootermopsis nevadensis]
MVHVVRSLSCRLQSCCDTLLKYNYYKKSTVSSYLYSNFSSSSTEILSEKYDVVVVGGGIVGMATAREILLRYPHLKMAVLEKEKELACHQTGHNSGVIHAGIYYKPGTLKAKLCVEGLNLAYKYCDEHNIPYKKCGKLIVATNPVEEKRLDDLYERGKKNNVKDLEMISAKRIKEIEPMCQGTRGLWSPHTGIVDWAEVTRSYGKDFTEKGGRIHLNFRVISFKETAESSSASKGDGNKYPVSVRGENSAVKASYVLTCGGLQSDELAQMSGGKINPKIVPFRGEYLLLNPKKQHMIKGNIYPVPDPRFPFLGVHFTPRMDGSIWIGPNAVLALKREGYGWCDVDVKELMDTLSYRGFQKMALKNSVFGISEMIKSAFITLQLREINKFIKEITADDLSR